MKENVVEMMMNRVGTRDTGCVLGISKGTVISVLIVKKCKKVNKEFLKKRESNRKKRESNRKIDVEIHELI